MPRVFHITCTKTIEATVLAESEADVRKAVLLEDVDAWDSGPDAWDVTAIDSFEFYRRMGKFPSELTADMFVRNGRVYEWSESEDYDDVLEMIKKAEAELKAMALDRLQVKLPFGG